MQVTSFNDNEAYESDKEEQKGNDLKVNGCIYIYIYIVRKTMFKFEKAYKVNIKLLHCKLLEQK